VRAFDSLPGAATGRFPCDIGSKAASPDLGTVGALD